MEKEKLYNTARSEAFDLVDCAHQTDSHDLVEAFVSGAEWLQSQPLSERLTEEEWEEYQELRLYANYAYHWGKSPVVCKKCGNLNPSGYICATCGWDNTYDPDEED